ncbi:putative short chain oxidoreductase/dehydrogenase [Xylariales sp. PMI_506]|nr:putative short chain oxidoreductase/dehydrogenase [Xylariales sp. PMI_506]
MPDSLRDTWLITGATSGLGFELAKVALAAGHIVVACCRDASKSPEVIAELSGLGASWLQLDVAASDVESKIEAAISEHGGIDVLVNNAGYAVAGSIEDTSIDHINSLFAVNFLGPVRAIRAVLPSMRARGGTIVNIGSSNGLVSLASLGIYSASKFALEALSEALYVELSSFNIRVLLVEPGAIATRFADTKASAVEIPFSEPYIGTAASQMLDTVMQMYDSGMAANPENMATRICEAVDGTGIFEVEKPGLRLPLGTTGAMLEAKGKELLALWERKHIWGSV